MTLKTGYRFFISLLCLILIFTAWSSIHASPSKEMQGSALAAVPASVFQADKDNTGDQLHLTALPASFSYFAAPAPSPSINGYLQPVISPALRPPTF